MTKLVWGFKPADWDRAKEQAREIMIEYARNRGMLPYSELVSKITAIRLAPDDARLAALLDEISTAEHAEGRGMLSVLVAHKVGDMEPGIGFYKLASALGNQFEDKQKFWIEELHRVHALWARNRARQ